jgi:hypothetical protein
LKQDTNNKKIKGSERMYLNFMWKIIGAKLGKKSYALIFAAS